MPLGCTSECNGGKFEIRDSKLRGPCPFFSARASSLAAFSVQSMIGFELDLRRFFFTKIDRRNWVSSFLELLSPNLQ